jgi:sugar-specific transcriptional regulator TrmB
MVGSSKSHPQRSTAHGSATAHGPAPTPIADSGADVSAEAAGITDPLTLGLVHLGLSPREAQLYFTLLRHGPETARHAIQSSHLDRATGYRVLSRLRVRGLVAATGHRPQQFVALEIGRLFERVAAFLRDDLELQRTIREVYQHELHQIRAPVGEAPRAVAPTEAAPGLVPRPRTGAFRVLPRGTEIGRFLCESIGGAKEEVNVLLRPQLIPEPFRAEVGQAIVRAVQRSVRLRIVLDYHPPEVDFLTSVLKTWDGQPSHLEVRFFAPQFARLIVTDRRIAMRAIGLPGSPGAGPEFAVVSDDSEFLRYQSSRFQTIWRDALPLEHAAPVAGGIRFVPTTSPRELRHWVEHTHRSDSRLMATAPWEYGPPRHPVLR